MEKLGKASGALRHCAIIYNFPCTFPSSTYEFMISCVEKWFKVSANVKQLLTLGAYERRKQYVREAVGHFN
jgi:hypothetical protein